MSRHERPVGPVPLRALLLFHLNLGFSTLEVEDRQKVVEGCYEPMLDLAERSGRPIAIEASGWTLARLAELAPEVLGRLRALVETGRIEFVGSGWAQVIGPLAPPQVNEWNQRLGREAYRELLGAEPTVALVNEMAYSAGLVDVYADAGYRALVLDRENARAALGIEDLPAHVAPHSVTGPGGAELPVIWSDTVLFQRFQRVVHGEISIEDYLEVLARRITGGQRVLPIYTNDVEVFGHRPGRFMTEAVLDDGEWIRIASVLDAVDDRFGVKWVAPSALLDGGGERTMRPEVEHLNASVPLGGLRLTNAANPVLVKKQRKYNLNRWALSGRDDLRLNTHAHLVALQAVNADDTAKRKACEWWMSDLRTHLAEGRWVLVEAPLAAAPRLVSSHTAEGQTGLSASVAGPLSPSELEPLLLRGPRVTVILDPRRGGAIRSLAFRSHDWTPTLGTLPQGSVSAIDVAADFYTGGVVVDLPGLARRLTDLEPCRIQQASDSTGTEAMIEAGRWPDGQHLARTSIRVPSNDSEEVVMRFDAGPTRPRGSVRVAHLTLLPDAFLGPLWVETVLGGHIERLALDQDVDHGRPVSLLVSSTTSLGGGGGEIRIGDDTRALRITWEPSACAAVPMLHHRRVGQTHLTRLWFSLAELDDTFRDGGRLLPFQMRVAAWTAARD